MRACAARSPSTPRPHSSSTAPSRCIRRSSNVRQLFADGQASFFHAVASPYRDRSHFDGQNVLETGGSAPYQVKDGWMNRLVGLLPRSGKEAIAFSPAVPMALRGAVEVTTYAPSALPQANDELMMRVEQLYARMRNCTRSGRRRSRHAAWRAAWAAARTADPACARPHGGGLPRPRRRAAHRDDRDRRLGHPQRAERAPRRPAQVARQPDRRTARRARGGLGANGDPGRHRVRPHRRRQRHRRHRSRHRLRRRCCSAAPCRAAASSPTGRGSRLRTCSTAAISSRPWRWTR